MIVIDKFHFALPANFSNVLSVPSPSNATTNSMSRSIGISGPVPPAHSIKELLSVRYRISFEHIFIGLDWADRKHDEYSAEFYVTKLSFT